MKTAYFNCSSGIAGDMIISSCLDAGIKLKIFENKLKNLLPLKGFSFKIEEVERHHLPAKYLTIHGARQFDSPQEIAGIFKNSRLSEKTKHLALRVLDQLVKAESKVHGVPAGRVHFHELNSLDTVIDIAGSALLLEMLGIKEVNSSALNIGRAAPATLEILKAHAVPSYSDDHEHELVTPTGAAIISNIARSFGGMPGMKLTHSGFGAGSLDSPKRANILRLFIGDTIESAVHGSDRIVLLETNIDDMDPRIYPYLSDKLFSLGAKDVWLSQIIMKHGRPAITLHAICGESLEQEITNAIFTESTTLGIRRQIIDRHILPRKMDGKTKTAFIGKKKRIKSEFRSAKNSAIRDNKTLKDILI